MSEQLLKMQETLQRQQGEKVLHQVAGGLAHQLRNSITGARMALELHQQRCELSDDSLDVALGQLEETEAHVRRLLTVASGREEPESPEIALACLQDSMRALITTAKHLRIELNTNFAPELGNVRVSDGPSLQAAFSNLVLNAMYEGSRVTVECALLSEDVEPTRGTLENRADGRKPGSAANVHPLASVQMSGDFALLTVCDNGKGPPPDVASEIFEPFVTSKPEGLGLGLPLVARCARRLDGAVHWDRVDQQTRFSLRFRVSTPPADAVGFEQNASVIK
jgi:hypothetical protein